MLLYSITTVVDKPTISSSKTIVSTGCQLDVGGDGDGDTCRLRLLLHFAASTVFRDKKIDRLMRKIEQGGFVESPPMPEHAPPPSGRKNFLAALAPLLLPLLALVGLFLSLSLSS